jgi:hypothetical protein
MQTVSMNVDIVMCIDCTGSMASTLDQVKANALKFYPDFLAELSKIGREVDQVRVKVIAFRDFFSDGDLALLESDFIPLNTNGSEFEDFVKNLSPKGGGDEPESSLEALALAMKSKWNKEGEKRREVIIMYTDSSAIPLEKDPKPAGYPSDLPKNLDEITDLWEGQTSPMTDSAKRLLIYAPNAYPWAEIGSAWTNTIHHGSKAGGGLAEHDYSTIMYSLAKTI